MSYSPDVDQMVGQIYHQLGSPKYRVIESKFINEEEQNEIG